ncbi:hypothetical protein QZH41_012597 [Actinostola sp. cb2023]|nr:hypothetical protein QZH41_012597 [Actinostola sp. cb2023]
MSSSESSLESSNNSEYTDSEFELEIEDIIQTINNNTVQSQRESETTSEDNNDTTNLDAFAYSDEPLAGEEWIAEYNRQEKETEELEENLTRRLDGTTPTSECFLRSVAYREFSRMVYGFLGKKRYPLPACAYSAIRVTFVNRSDEGFTGFEMEEEM